MNVFTSIAEAGAAARRIRSQGETLGLVPTMGALHEGHLALVRTALKSCGAVAVSIFVNPLQFGPGEDFGRYPRTLEEDCRQLADMGVTFVFAPPATEMYPEGSATSVEVGGLSDRLDGASRPGHFRGVATVVAKLFHIISPHQAFFGQKDAAQVAVLKKMVRDLNFDLELRVCPTVRAADGLALSSRNRFLTDSQRRQALVLHHALTAVQRLVQAGEYCSPALLAEGLRVMRGEPGARLDYFAIVDPETLEDVADVRRGALVAAAAFIANTRLIDNILLTAV